MVSFTNKQEDRIQLHGGSATYPTCMAAHSISVFFKTKEKISSATAFLEAVVVQPHFLETRETSKESFGKCTDVVVIQPHFLEPRETSKESFGKCTELVVAQRQNLKTRETRKESFGKCTELVVVQPHVLELRETSKESFGKCTELVVDPAPLSGDSRDQQRVLRKVH